MPRKEPNTFPGHSLAAGTALFFHWLVHTRTGTAALIMTLLLFVAGIAVTTSLMAAGLCRSEWRFPPDEEFLTAGIRGVMSYDHFQHRREIGGGAAEFRSFAVVPYASVEEFRSQNPDCCRVVSPAFGERLPSIWDRIDGTWARTVEVAFNIHYLDDRLQPETEKVTWNMRLTNCAQVWRPGR
jgi:hypothetical protein